MKPSKALRGHASDSLNRNHGDCSVKCQWRILRIRFCEVSRRGGGICLSHLRMGALPHLPAARIFGLSLWSWQTIQDIDPYGLAVQNLIRWSVGSLPCVAWQGKVYGGPPPPHTIINFISDYTNICVDLSSFEFDKYGTTT